MTHTQTYTHSQSFSQFCRSYPQLLKAPQQDREGPPPPPTTHTHARAHGKREVSPLHVQGFLAKHLHLIQQTLLLLFQGGQSFALFVYLLRHCVLRIALGHAER